MIVGKCADWILRGRPNVVSIYVEAPRGFSIGCSVFSNLISIILPPRGNPFKIYPNLLMSEMQIDRPLQCVVSDMTAFYVKGIYYELTLYMDLWNNEILAHALSSRRGDRETAGMKQNKRGWYK